LPSSSSSSSAFSAFFCSFLAFTRSRRRPHRDAYVPRCRPWHSPSSFIIQRRGRLPYRWRNAASSSQRPTAPKAATCQSSPNATLRRCAPLGPCLPPSSCVCRAHGAGLAGPAPTFVHSGATVAGCRRRPFLSATDVAF
jgi:hypothetical protein